MFVHFTPEIIKSTIYLHSKYLEKEQKNIHNF